MKSANYLWLCVILVSIAGDGVNYENGKQKAHAQIDSRQSICQLADNMV
jgi:hypothetical protein